jgi:hypothetical protein
MTILYARQIAAQEAGLFLDVPLRETLLQTIGADRGADFHGDASSPVPPFGGSVQIITFTVNTAREGMASGNLGGFPIEFCRAYISGQC